MTITYALVLVVALVLPCALLLALVVMAVHEALAPARS